MIFYMYICKFAYIHTLVLNPQQLTYLLAHLPCSTKHQPENRVDSIFQVSNACCVKQKNNPVGVQGIAHKLEDAVIYSLRIIHRGKCKAHRTVSWGYTATSPFDSLVSRILLWTHNYGSWSVVLITSKDSTIEVWALLITEPFAHNHLQIISQRKQIQ